MFIIGHLVTDLLLSVSPGPRHEQHLLSPDTPAPLMAAELGARLCPSLSFARIPKEKTKEGRLLVAIYFLYRPLRTIGPVDIDI